MHLKANLHLHTNDDPEDRIQYSTYEVIDHAASLGFDVLALTCHNHYAWCEAYATYASERGITLLRGIEATIKDESRRRGKHVLILGADKDVEEVRTFSELIQYKQTYPHIVIIAPHPYFDPFLSLQGLAEKYINLFDAIEHSWFYSKWFNRNKKAIVLAHKHQKPLVATSDTHFLDHLNEHYTLIETPDQSEASILQAIKDGSVAMQTRPHRFWREMLLPQLKFMLQDRFRPHTQKNTE